MKSDFWKVIPGHPRYEISRDGQVRLRNIQQVVDGEVIGETPSRIISYHINTANNFREIYIDGSTAYIHRLLAQTFLENPDGHKFVDFKDGNSANTTVDNIQWCKQSPNNEVPTYKGKTVVCLETGERYQSLKEASELTGYSIYRIKKSINQDVVIDGKHYRFAIKD